MNFTFFFSPALKRLTLMPPSGLSQRQQQGVDHYWMDYCYFDLQFGDS